MAASGTAQMCVNLYKKFICGQGFLNEAINEIEIYPGFTLFELISDVRNPKYCYKQTRKRMIPHWLDLVKNICFPQKLEIHKVYYLKNFFLE